MFLSQPLCWGYSKAEVKNTDYSSKKPKWQCGKEVQQHQQEILILCVYLLWGPSKKITLVHALYM